MENSKSRRQLTAILHADVAGYSRLMGENEDATLRVLTGYREAMLQNINRHYGEPMGTAGDSLLARFSSVVEAVACAVEIQKELYARNEALPESRRLNFRIGINIGDVIFDGDSIYGDGVNVAARLETLAEPGGICVAESVRFAVGNRLEVSYEFLGEQTVKNIAEPVRAYRVVFGLPYPINASPAKPQPPRAWLRPTMLVGLLTLLAMGLMIWLLMRPPMPERQGSLQPAAKPSIAVLPFTNMSGSPEQEYFADGITEDIITDLSRISGLFVIARNSTFRYKGRQADLKQIATDLDVRYVLEGSVRRDHQEIRINVRLVDAKTRHQVWAQRYDGLMGEIFDLQDKVTASVTRAMTVQLTEGEQIRVTQKNTANPDAYDLYLQGWQHYLKQQPSNFKTAISYFDKAIEIDPQYSRAYAALAATYWQATKRFWHESLGQPRWHDTRAAAEQYLASAMRNPTTLAYQVAADMHAQSRRYDEAVADAERAIALDPNDADSYVALAGVLSLMGRSREALGLIDRAMRLNPYYPPYYLYYLGLAQFNLGYFEKTAETLKQATALNPDDRWPYRLLLATYGHLGRLEDAKKIVEKVKKIDERGYQEYADPLTVRSAAFWLPFQQPADAARLAEGLRKADVPD